MRILVKIKMKSLVKIKCSQGDESEDFPQLLDGDEKHIIRLKVLSVVAEKERYLSRIGYGDLTNTLLDKVDSRGLTLIWYLDRCRLL